MTNANKCLAWLIFFFFNDTATTEIYTLSLHDALPISRASSHRAPGRPAASRRPRRRRRDRKSTRLNSSHVSISYAVFCLKKKQKRMGQVSSVEEIRDNYTHGNGHADY